MLESAEIRKQSQNSVCDSNNINFYSYWRHYLLLICGIFLMLVVLSFYYFFYFLPIDLLTSSETVHVKNVSDEWSYIKASVNGNQSIQTLI